MPRDAHDLEAARALIALGWPALEPICGDMLRRIKDHGSPVADAFCDFFVAVGEPAAAGIRECLLTSRHSHLKYQLVSQVITRWPREAVAQVVPALQALVTHTNLLETDLLCIEILDRYALCEREWLKQWLRFKRARAEQYRAFAIKLEKQIT